MPQAKAIGDKIKEYFSEVGMSQTDIASVLDVQQAAVSNQLNGRRFGKNAAAKWSNAFGFRENWLRTGEGPMFDPDNTPNTDGMADDHPELKHDEDIPVIPARIFRAPEINTYEYVMNSSYLDAVKDLNFSTSAYRGTAERIHFSGSPLSLRITRLSTP